MSPRMRLSLMFGALLLVLGVVSASLAAADGTVDSPVELMRRSVAWGYLPDVATSLGRMERSRFQAALPKAARQRGRALSQQGAGGLLFGWAAGATTPTSASPVALLPVPAGEPLSLERLAAPRALQGREASPDLLALLDVQRYYGWLAKQRDGLQWGQVVRRLQLDGAREVTLRAWLEGLERGRASVDVLVPKSKHGLTAAVGPLVPVQAPRVARETEGGYAVFSVYPNRLWAAAERVAAGLRPIEYSLWLLQLEALEKQLGKRFVGDVLGSESRLWTVHLHPSATGQRRAFEATLVADVADGRAARDFVEAMALIARGLMPELGVSEKMVSGVKVLSLTGGRRARARSELLFAFLPRRVIVGPSSEALAPHLKTSARGRARLAGVASDARAVAFGDTRRLPRKATRALMHGTGLWRLLGGEEGERVADSLAAAVAKTSWTVAPTAEGYHLDAFLSAR